ncbi:MAG: M6 family metalloprotease domain-containing protein [Dysgonamonadaceae bacterium]|jgi:M6 family metalloprotease-like protein|nr:M6 family metalloprotease domain-containing protein [Dysgonamonadaceae bacterium]
MSKQIFKCVFLTFFVFLTHYFSAWSVPAYPYFTTLNPGTKNEITLRARGDERIKWMESDDGYTLLYDANKIPVYAVLDESGDLTPSNLRAVNPAYRSPETEAALVHIPKRLFYSEKQKQLFRQIATMESEVRLRSVSLRSTGDETAKALCALIQFTDLPMVKTLQEFENLMNQKGYKVGGAYGSVRDFYLENSYGQLDMIMTVVGPYTAAKPWRYYGQNGAGGNDLHVNELAREAANFAFKDPAVTPADFDNDGDGYIDAFHIIHAGYGEEYSGADPDNIWSHESGFWPTLTFSGKKLDTYSCSPELRGISGTNISTIGPVCHELGHVFGAPDFYDADGEGSGGDFLGTGNWDLMAGGSWLNSGSQPAHFNMYQKIVMGWVTPVELKVKQQVTNMLNSAQNPVAYIIKTPVINEYYVLENRQKQGFDGSIPSHGLLIYHVSVTQQQIAANTVNNGHPQRVYPVYASSNLEIPTGTVASYGDINDTRVNKVCPFSRNKGFTDSSLPAMRLWNGTLVSKPITEIQEPGGTISFKFMYESTLGINLEATVSNGQVQLNWTTPDIDISIDHYNIYRDGVFIQSTTETTYRDILTQSGVYVYGVSIVPTGGTETAKEEIQVTVTLSAINQPETTLSRIYPNPLRPGQKLTVDLGENQDKAELFFYTITGQLLLHQTVTTPVSHHPLNWSSGTYLLKIIGNREVKTIKFYIQ